MANRKTIYVTANGQMAFGQLRIVKSHDGKTVNVYEHEEIAGLTDENGKQMYMPVGHLRESYKGWTLKEVAELMQRFYGDAA